jgi:hypothetical protein
MGRTRTLQTIWTLSALTAGLTGTTACDSLLETTTWLTQAITAEDSAATDDVAATDATDDAATDDAGMDGDCNRPAGERGRPGEPPPEFGELDVAACAPPVAEGVTLGRPPHGRGHLAPVYDADESRSLDDAELAALQADVTAGCTARNAALITDFDEDGDGLLSRAEWDAARAARRAAHEEERQSLDTDGDGEISSEEHDAARAALIATWDADGSGDLDEAERAAMRTDVQALVRAGEPLPPLPFMGAHHGPGGHGGHGGIPSPPDSDDSADDGADDSATE